MVTGISIEQPLRIGYLGPEGTFSAAAAAAYAPDGAELVACRSLHDIVEGVKTGDIDQGVLPAENAAEGSLSETLDLLIAEHCLISITGELVLPVQHRLLARPGVGLEDVRVLLSHPQALAQCRGSMASRLKGAIMREAFSTADAARMVASTDQPWACLGTAEAASIYGLETLDDNACDMAGNATRFIIIARKGPMPDEGDKTSLLVHIVDRPGALHFLLGVFARRGLSLSRIESRPARTRLGEYLFLIDVEGHAAAPPLAGALDELRGLCKNLVVLGSYPAAIDHARGKEVSEKSIEDIRQEIDDIDSQIVELLARRVQMARSIGRLKRGPLKDPAREEAILDRLKRLASRRGYDPRTLERIYRLLFDHSVTVQQAGRDKHH